MCSNSSLKSLSQLKAKFTWDHHGVGEKSYSNDSGQLLFFILILSAAGGGGFSGNFTTNLVRQCRAFSGALIIERLKAPLFRGPEGAGATNDWCITPKGFPKIPWDFMPFYTMNCFWLKPYKILISVYFIDYNGKI